MKVMISGKGGSGKSSITVLSAQVLSRYYNVYVVDSDESNTLLPRMLGVEQPKPLVEYLGGKKSIFKQGESNIVKALATAGQGIELDRLPSEYVSVSPKGFQLITIGKVRTFGDGCACPFNYLTRVLLKNLALKKNDLVLIDTDAGMEYVGRAVIEGVDALLAVADPTAESLSLIGLLKKAVESAGKRFWLILNKVTPDIADKFKEKAVEKGLEVSGVVRFDGEIFSSCLEGGPLEAKEALTDIENVLKTTGLIPPQK